MFDFSTYISQGTHPTNVFSPDELDGQAILSTDIELVDEDA